ncbi:OmpA family protein [Nannocystis sp. SCPEA4]|uniref:OmpA family protein n=1 Tax=Nannocystis sp. SCPEA4 TaxID=2996787 RepID=UPI002271151F|nr:OmpA family protein [Nannocystis sp. SCPEA4]MCY1061832.1 OmpA family protein [Nannocystis sp. SCPEA4]
MTHATAPRRSPGLLAAALVAALPAGAGARHSLSMSAGPSGHVQNTTTEGPAPAPTATVPTPTPVAPAAGSAARCQDARDVPWIRRCRPERNTVELGAFAGVFFTGGSAHELFDPHRQLASVQDGDPDAQFFKPYRTAAPQFGGRIGFYPLAFLGGEVEAAVMPTRTLVDGHPAERAVLFNFRGNLIAQLPFWRVAPFALVGGGGLGTSGALGRDIDQSVHFGGGLKVFLSHRALLRLDVRDVVAARRRVDAGAVSYPEIQLGVSALLGRKAPARRPDKDSDGDGFLDRGDACPFEPGIAPDGCPERDRDGDGFMDSQDACPDVPGIAPDGCPERDRDGDGFLDSRDRCPDVPGVAPHGCPIPDSDGDGILDDVDRCVDRPETLNGFEDADGCPDELPDDVFHGVIRGIYFDLDRDTIKQRSRPVLDRAVSVLAKYGSIRIEISGHTDSTGGLEYNRDLSRRRADSVRRYLVEHGIDGARMTTRGAGPDEPIDTNRTAAGRARNRRIEFTIVVQ